MAHCADAQTAQATALAADRAAVCLRDVHTGYVVSFLEDDEAHPCTVANGPLYGDKGFFELHCTYEPGLVPRKRSD